MLDTSAYNPKANGKVENSHATLHDILRAMVSRWVTTGSLYKGWGGASAGGAEWAEGPKCSTDGLLEQTPLHSTPYTLHPTPCTPHPTPNTLHPTSYTLHLTPYLGGGRGVGRGPEVLERRLRGVLHLLEGLGFRGVPRS